jgi:hypothetical protein
MACADLDGKCIVSLIGTAWTRSAIGEISNVHFSRGQVHVGRLKAKDVMSKYRFVDKSISGAAILGVLASIFLSFVGVMELNRFVQMPASNLVKFTAFCSFLVGALFLAWQHGLADAIPPKALRLSLYIACPDWLKRSCFILMIVGVFLFCLPMVLALTGSGGAKPGLNHVSLVL